MVVAELYDKDTGEFMCLIMVNNRNQMEELMQKMAFTCDVEIDAVDLEQDMVLQ